MKRILKFILRLFITVLGIFVIIFSIGQILKIKHKDKLNETITNGWDWTKENNNYLYLLGEKYTGENLLIRMKNLSVEKKNENEKRILIVGDSFVYGTGSTNVNYLWWGQLNWRLKEAGYSNINVYAAGYYGLNTKEELELILKNDELINKIDPDLIIIGYVVNDPEEKDEKGNAIVKANWELDKENNDVYIKNPTLYYELLDRLYSYKTRSYEELVELGNLLGGQRWDVRCLYLVQDERLERYEKELQAVDNRMKELNIPYFFAFTNNLDNNLVEEANVVVSDLMKKLNIPVYYKEYKSGKLLQLLNTNNSKLFDVNPVDSHPGIVWTYDYSKKIFEELKKNYSFIFDKTNKIDADKIELNINDTMPFLNIKKIEKNKFEFEYPEHEEKKEEYSNFLYYPLEKNYIKLNLEYPKNVKKIKITGDNLEYAEIYVNTIDEEYGFDINEAYQKLTVCKPIKDDDYEVNKKITSVNIHAVFKNEKDRTLRIEFIE